MKFNFSLRGKQSADSRYTFVKAGMPDARRQEPTGDAAPAAMQEDLYRSRLAISYADDPGRPFSEDAMSVRGEILATDPEWVARMAIHFDEEKNFRDAAIWLTAELAAAYGKQERTALLVEQIVRQPADIPVWLAYFSPTGGEGLRPAPVVRKGLGRTFNRLEEYAFARYSREMQVALREALPFLRAKASDPGKGELFAKIL